MVAEVGGNLQWKPFLGLMSRMMEREDVDDLVRLNEARDSEGPLDVTKNKTRA